MAMNEVQVVDELEASLRDFHARVRASAPVKKILAWWERTVEIRSATAPRRSFYLRSEKGEMLEPVTQAPASGADVVIVADEEVLRGIFRGEVNPARAHLDGLVAAVGSQKDQLVLDSIVLLIWGY
jgi:putative sterol carrier protein